MSTASGKEIDHNCGVITGIDHMSAGSPRGFRIGAAVCRFAFGGDT
jgi:hypothetical protein